MSTNSLPAGVSQLYRDDNTFVGNRLPANSDPGQDLRSNGVQAAATKTLLVLGTRGVPAQHGGFETFAQQLAIHAHSKGWSATVYCQARRSEIGNKPIEDTWNGINRTLIPSRDSGSLASIAYDMRCIFHAARRPGTILLLGYNTAVFALILWVLKRNVVINMDGLEWKRPKWSRLARSWLWMNERIASMIGTTLVADHPEIKRHLVKFTRPSKVVMIPYGADLIDTASSEPVLKMGLTPGAYYICIARIEPENSQLEIVKAFSRAPRNKRLVVLGNLDAKNPYHRAVQEAASGEVIFAGTIYDKPVVSSLRFHAAAYCHGHTVGGTNPSLVEALGASCPVIAHDNAFNRWTAGQGQFFFSSVDDCANIFDLVSTRPDLLESARVAARQRHNREFQLDYVLAQHERLIGFDLQTYCSHTQAPARLAVGEPMPMSLGSTVALERMSNVA